jgi:hypothetical protein
VVGGIVAAAGVGVALKGGGGGGDSSQNQDVHVVMGFTPFPDGTVCGGPVNPNVPPGTVLSGNFVVTRAGGSFDYTKPDSSPYIRVSGQITPTTFSATLACLSGAFQTTLTATGANFSFSGAYTFSGRSGTWTADAPGFR